MESLRLKAVTRLSSSYFHYIYLRRNHLYRMESMTIEMHKFGETLVAHPEGREAFLGYRPCLLHDLGPTEEIVIDFQGVAVLTPSFAVEFITPLLEQYPRRVSFKNTKNITVQKTLEFLSEQWPSWVANSMKDEDDR